MQPKIAISIQTWAPENKKYLDLCIRSIENLNYPRELIEVIITCPKHNQVSYPNVKSVTPDKDYYSSVEGANFGAKHISQDVKHILFLNDDCVMTRDSLRLMVEMAELTGQVIHPISPCDNMSAYNLQFAIQKRDAEPIEMSKRFYRYEELEAHLDDMMNSFSWYAAGLIPQDHLCMFATLVPKKVWDEVGEFDQTFETGQDDIDYTWRIREKGYQLFIALHALIWHFGGVTSSTSVGAEKRKNNIKYFVSKWQRFPPGMDERIYDVIDKQYS